jgi:hypothetical protein
MMKQIKVAKMSFEAYSTDNSRAAKSTWTPNIIQNYCLKPNVENILTNPMLVAEWWHTSGKEIRTYVKLHGEESLVKTWKSGLCVTRVKKLALDMAQY